MKLKAVQPFLLYTIRQVQLCELKELLYRSLVDTFPFRLCTKLISVAGYILSIS
jgi:hypothetical protein